jgi:hypothetical protein
MVQSRANLSTSDRPAARADAKDPKGLEIPVPKRKDVMNVLRKLVQPLKKEE